MAEPDATSPATAWVARLPPPPFVDPESPPGKLRFAPLSPRVGVLIAAAVVVGLLLWMARDSVRPFIIGLLLVYLLDPPVKRLAARGVPRVLAIALVYLLALVFIVVFLEITLAPLINELLRFIDELPSLALQLQAQIERLSDIYARLEIPAEVREWIDGVIESITEGAPGGGLDILAFLPLVTGAGSLIGALFGYIVLPVWAFYLLKDRVALMRAFDQSLPAAWRFDIWALMRIAKRDFGQWVRGQLLLGLTVGVLTFAGLVLLSITIDPIFGRYAILLSVTAGILELVPIIGPIIAAVPAVLLAATASVEAVIAALVLYTLVQQLENNLLVPKIQGDAIDLHPALVIFAIIVGGALAGLLGAILALPIAAALRDVVRYLFRRLSPESPAALASSIDGLGLEVHPGLPPGSAPPTGVEPPSGNGPGPESESGPASGAPAEAPASTPS